MKLYFVEVTGRAILWLSACELLKFVFLDVDSVHKVEVGDILNTLLEDTENINVDIINCSLTKQGQIRPKLPVSKLYTLRGLSQVIFTCWPL